jgi:hypothetical protein
VSWVWLTAATEIVTSPDGYRDWIRALNTLSDGWRAPRFAIAVLGAVAASLALLAVSLATTTTPEQARAQRAIPDLPPPTMAVSESSRTGVVAVPEGAILTDGAGRTWVRVWNGRTARSVTIRRVHPDGVRPDLPKLVEVAGTGLHAGDLVELIASEDAVAPPQGRG